MAKETGLGANFYIDGVDLSGDVGAMRSISKSMQVLPVTGIDKYAFERRASKLDASMDWQSWFNPSAGQEHATLKNVTRIDRIATYLHKTTLGVPGASIVCKQTNYDPTRGNDGSLTINVDTVANAQWMDWGLSLTAGKRTDTGATNGSSVDFSAASAFGLQAYLHVFSFTGTNVTIKLQQSSDNGAGDAFADITGGAFTAVTSAPDWERIATSRTEAIERYIRLVTTGTFTSAIFAVTVTVNRTSLVI
jgi:hypothetical protein